MSVRYIALLRAINVGGHTVSMEKLRGLFAELNLKNVRSYIQTGNVFFESTENRDDLQIKIEQHLRKNLGYDVPTCLRTVEEFEHALASAPFKDTTPDPEDRYLIVFLSSPMPKDTQFPLVSPKQEYEIVGATGQEAFVIMHLLNGKPGNPIYLEKMLTVKATSRFYHTSVKILTAAKNV